MPDSKSQFFEEQRQQSQAKAEIVVEYFSKWSSVMLKNIKTWGHVFATDRLMYLDLYSGPGTYADGKDSTPLLVLKEALGREDLKQYLECVFNDSDAQHIQKLEEAISKLPLKQFKFPPECYETEVDQQVVDIFREAKLPPTLLFADPFGYKGLTLDLVNSIIKDFGSECIFFFNYNRIQAAIKNPIVEKHMLMLFGTPERLAELRELANGSALKEETILETFYDALTEKHAKYYCTFRFPDQERNATSHYLIYVTKHELGYKIMNNIMANASTSKDPDGFCSFDCDPKGARQLKSSSPLIDLAAELAIKFAGGKHKLDEIFLAHSPGKPFVRANYVAAVWLLRDQGSVTFLGQQPSKRTHCGEKTTVQFASR